MPGLLTPSHAAIAIGVSTLSLVTAAIFIFQRQDFSG